MKTKEIIKYEKRMYFKDEIDFIKAWISTADNYKIWRFLVALRRSEYFKNGSKKNKVLIPVFIFYSRRKNKLGRKLGFDIPEGCFQEGLRIFHASSIIVNPYARIGKNCSIVGNVRGANDAPQVGDNCMFGWGSAAIGSITIADNCAIGAKALLTHNVMECNATMVGIPAKNINI